MFDANLCDGYLDHTSLQRPLRFLGHVYSFFVVLQCVEFRVTKAVTSSQSAKVPSGKSARASTIWGN
jgi:hypothetical protein